MSVSYPRRAYGRLGIAVDLVEDRVVHGIGGGIEDHPAFAQSDNPVGEFAREINLMETDDRGDTVFLAYGAEP